MDYKLEIINNYSPNHEGLYKGIVRLTKPINDTYPAHTDWLVKTFMPGLKNGTRKIIVAYDDLDNPMGVALLKDTEDEKKICCLFVRDDCRGKGIGGQLIKKSGEALKTDRPLITVADRNLPQLQKLLDRNKFVFSYKKKGVYQKYNVENYFNNAATEVLKRDVLAPLLAYKLKQR